MYIYVYIYTCIYTALRAAPVALHRRRAIMKRLFVEAFCRSCFLLFVLFGFWQSLREGPGAIVRRGCKNNSPRGLHRVRSDTRAPRTHEGGEGYC